MDLALAAAVGLAVVWVPGAAITRALRVGSRDGIARFAQELALGISFWPALFLFTTLAGVSWNANGARLVFAIAGCWLLVRSWFAWRSPRFLKGGWRAIPLAALFLLAVVVYTRMRQVDDVVLPLWVDSVHHTMIVRLLVEHGRLPESYAPFIPESTFYYHWGFHSLTAFVGWVSGLTGPGEVPRLLLGFGQLLNVWVFPAMYSAGLGLFRSRRTALLAATVATLISIFPAYYVSWGRYTQLCGLLLLPPLAWELWKLGRHPSLGRAIEVTLLAGALVLIHVRVAVVFAILAILLSALLALQRRWRGLAFLAAAGAAAALMTLPWIVHLARAPQVQKIMAPKIEERGQWETSNAVPPDLVWVPRNPLLFAVASGGLIGLTPFPLDNTTRTVAIVWWIILVLLLQRKVVLRRKTGRRGVRRFDGWRVSLVVVWVLVSALLVNLDQVGLPRLRMLSNSAALIMLFLPLSLLAAHLIRWSGDVLVGPARRRGVFVGFTLVAGVAGAATMLHIVNPVTVLATAADRRALEWIGTHTPAQARFAVGVQPWIGGSFVGIDGGYWIPLVADRQSNLPPGLYPWVMPAGRVATITRSLSSWHAALHSGEVPILDALHEQGVTHLYFGPRNNTVLRAALAASPALARVYDAGGVEIYALVSERTLDRVLVPDFTR